MSLTSKASKRERLEARVTTEQKELFQQAADLEGRSLTSFIVDSLQASAEETIARHERITLSAGASIAFVNALLDPSEPASTLQDAARRYRTFQVTQSE